jgi:ATP-dependent DNA helicase
MICVCLLRFTPSVPVLLYHGSVEERARLRAKRLVMGRTGVADTFPVVVTSYEIVMNDRKHLQRFRWKYGA